MAEQVQAIAVHVGQLDPGVMEQLAKAGYKSSIDPRWVVFVRNTPSPAMPVVPDQVNGQVATGSQLPGQSAVHAS